MPQPPCLTSFFPPNLTRVAVLYLAILVLLPGLLWWGESRLRLIAWLGPPVLAYALGIALGNLWPPERALIDGVLGATVAPALPLLLVSAHVRHWFRLAPGTAVSYLLWLVAIVLCSLAAAWTFRDWLGPQVPAMAAMAASVYTGGTANMGAVQLAIGAPGSLLSELTLVDLMLSGLYLILLLSAAPRLLRRVLPPFRPAPATADPLPPPPVLAGRSRSEQIRGVLVSLLLGAGLVALMAGGVWLLTGRLAEIPLMIGLTLAGLLLSFWRPLRTWPGTYETGQYLFLIFCVAVGTLADLRVLLSGPLPLIGFMATVAYGSVLLHTALAVLFRLDTDTVLITHVAGVFGPPFIGPVAETLHNREIVVSGLTLSVINLALGNFMGLGIYALLA